MADDKNTGFSSAFDSLLDTTRKRFEERSAGTFNRGLERAAGTPILQVLPPAVPSPAARPATDLLPPKSSEPSTPPPSSSAVLIDGPSKSNRKKSVAARKLDERFGEGWSYEVTERRREGDEMIVLCRVEIPDKDISKTQFGSAKVLKPGERFTLQGTVDGVPIGIAVGRGAPLKRDPEETAYRRAVDVALAKCAELL